MASAKRRAAGDPASHLPGPHDTSGIVMQDATIAHQCASIRYGHDLAKGRHPILERQSCLPGSIKERETEHTCYDALYPF
jgi:hypothetical protein